MLNVFLYHLLLSWCPMPSLFGFSGQASLSWGCDSGQSGSWPHTEACNTSLSGRMWCNFTHGQRWKLGLCWGNGWAGSRYWCLPPPPGPGKSLKPFPSSFLFQKRLRFCPKKLINTSYKSINHLDHLAVTDNFLQVKRFLNITLSCKLWIKSKEVFRYRMQSTWKILIEERDGDIFKYKSRTKDV